MSNTDQHSDRRPRWRQEVSLGNVIQIGIMLAGLAAGWTQLRADQDSMRSDFERRLNLLEQSDRERGARDIQQVGLLADMRADIRVMREQLDRLERQERRKTR